MNNRDSRDPAWIGALGLVYRGALWLYPPSHRRRFGREMACAFRDRCREAARAGRGPFAVLFAELLPDLARTVGAEHLDTVLLETNPMKRLLYVLIAAFIAVVLLHSQITPALDAVHRWNNARVARAHARDYSGYMESTAKATLAQRRDSRDDVMAAILYREAADASVPFGDDATGAIDPATADALRDRADAAFARALKADDRWALWLAARQCPARPSTCQPDRALARLEQLDADNGAVWALDLAAAQKAGDSGRARKALGRMAAATRFATQDRETVVAALSVFDQHPVPVGLRSDRAVPAADASAEFAWRVVEMYHPYVFNEYPELKPFSDYCRAADPQVHAERRADCRAAGRNMVEKAGAYFGYFAWMRNADPDEAMAAREAFRVHQWQVWGYGAATNTTGFELTPARWRAYWMASDHRAALASRAPLPPPASFQLRPEQYDPAY